MRGRIIRYEETSYKGAINGQDGNRYDFVAQDWRSTGKPKVGLEVDFKVDGMNAREIYAIAGDRNSASLMAVYFSFQGRLSRKDYWLKGVLLFFLFAFVISIVAIVLDIATGSISLDRLSDSNRNTGPFSVLTQLFFIWPGLAIQVKRWHDRDRSGWFALIGLVPFIGLALIVGLATTQNNGLFALIGIISVIPWIWIIIELGFLPGTPGENKYGPDPRT